MHAIGEKSPSLTMSAVSSTFWRALLYALVEERHFALVDGLRISNLGSLGIVRVRNSVRPRHLFDHSLRSRFTSSNSLISRERDAQSLHR